MDLCKMRQKILRMSRSFKLFLTVALLWLSLTLPASAEGFLLCPDSAKPCARASYFVGYEQRLRDAVGNVSASGMRLYPGIADAAERVEKSDLQHIEQLQVGEMAEVQTLRLPLPDELSPAQSSPAQLSPAQPSQKLETALDLLWGDTFRISSKRLSVGDPVALRIERQVVNEVEALTAGSSDRLTLKTWVNSHVLPKLDYQLAKFEGAREQVREQGDRKASVSVLAKVGEVVRLESRLRMRSGLSAGGGAEALLGSHEVRYRVELLSDDSCARSESGLLTTGDCEGL